MTKLVVEIKFSETLFEDLEEIQSDKVKEIQIDRQHMICKHQEKRDWENESDS